MVPPSHVLSSFANLIWGVPPTLRLHKFRVSDWVHVCLCANSKCLGLPCNDRQLLRFPLLRFPVIRISELTFASMQFTSWTTNHYAPHNFQTVVYTIDVTNHSICYVVMQLRKFIAFRTCLLLRSSWVLALWPIEVARQSFCPVLLGKVASDSHSVFSWAGQGRQESCGLEYHALHSFGWRSGRCSLQCLLDIGVSMLKFKIEPSCLCHT